MMRSGRPRWGFAAAVLLAGVVAARAHLRLFRRAVPAFKLDALRALQEHVPVNASVFEQAQAWRASGGRGGNGAARGVLGAAAGGAGMKKARVAAFGLTLGMCVAANAGGDTNAVQIARALGSTLADAVERVMPAVVVIRTQATVYHAARDVFFGRIYGIPEQQAGQGSGVIIDRQGHVLTSHHVIQNAERIEVALHDGARCPARIVGRDPYTDLAVLQIEGAERLALHPIELGDSDRLRVGEFVIAIGSPFSLDSSVTLGIVSQKGREMGLLPYEDFIQTDASINPGNSGGPLVDVDGRMVGINAMITTGGPNNRGNIGIGFAVPVNLAMIIADSLIRHGKAERPWIGVRLGNPPAGAARRGAMIYGLLEKGPADLGGLKEGDLIVAADGQPVENPHDLQLLIIKRQAGDAIRLTVLRGAEERAFEVCTAPMPDFTAPVR